ncbi:TetR/AcrR family transcriptional regulator [Marinicella rhabdoformis]|uniref:TetR/AcrR family transcriptional regulator n=1 Tax=Marinicella rhabdoformis TaxID=2580566 RepID=UPI0012AEC414|nr:TetR/AcrR family transcriptional regulator [Marinicella rhabdoformis]
MPIIVDKDNKRRKIAIACTELLLEKGLKDLRISEIAKTAGIGKGTVYDYFTNKEDVVFEIIRNIIQEHQDNLNERSNENTTTREKVYYLFDFYLCEFKEYKQHLEVYKEYIAATLSTDDKSMIEFNRECTTFIHQMLTKIIFDGISKGEIKAVAENLITGIMVSERGFMLMDWSENIINKKVFKVYLNTIFDLIEIKDEKNSITF